MPTKAELRRKIAELHRQLQTATENYKEAQSTIKELQEVTSGQNALTDDRFSERA